MRTKIAALAAGLLLLGAAPAAMADTGGQSADQSAGNRQSGSSDAMSGQTNPVNSNISVRIHSPGDNGSVSQTNSSSAGSSATNDNTLGQMLDQQGTGNQDASQGAWNDQRSDSGATSVQYDPQNESISVRIHSPGSDGGVSQSNDSSASSSAGNTNGTTQDLGQSQGGRGSACCSSGTGVQAGSQDASSYQRSDSSADSRQDSPSNEAISVRIHSPGDNGSVSQTNSSSADSSATNDNTTSQELRQAEGGSGGVQAADQGALNGQGALSDALSRQDGPANRSSGGGDVTQGNSSTATSNASNSNTTDQALEQLQGGAPVLTSCCSRRPQVQAASQDAKNLQLAKSRAGSLQICPLNESDGGFGGFGSLSQSNSSDASSEGANTNALMQRMSQLLGSPA